MRWLLRLLLFWAVSGPLFYLYGLPYLMDMLSQKARTEAFGQCEQQLKSQGLTGSPNSPLHEQQAVGYCHCISDELVMTKADIMDTLHKRPPAALSALAQAKADTCNVDLQRALGYLPPEPEKQPAPDTDMVPL